MIEFEHLLPLVQKPSRYIDNEINACHKDFEAAEVRMLFGFPDIYELGVSHLGLKILYSVINSLPYAMADRVYLPAQDFIDALKGENLPLYGVESRRAASDFDVLGITFQSELTYSSALELIHSSGISVFSRERKDIDPIVLAGGPCISNPLPLAPFIDAFFLGEAEEGIVEIAEVLKTHKDRAQRLEALKQVEGVWVPEYFGDGPWDITIPDRPIKSRKFANFHEGDIKHEPQLLSWQLATHNRYVAEIMRGCSRGCRFCHAGYFYRPVRERNPNQILDDLLREVESSGWDEAGLVSLSSSDYTCIRELLLALLQRVDTKRTHISLPSLRVDSLDDRLVSLMQSLGREGLTIAPEAGSQRLRDVINKNLSEEEILEGVAIAQKLGWQKIKLYFMIGLPMETEEDIDEIVALVEKINTMAGKRMSINVSLSPFTPKPFTPFQWSKMVDGEMLLDRALSVKHKLIKYRNIRIKYHVIENSVLDACLARGDISMAKVLHRAWEKGAIYDGWREHWDWTIWQEAFDFVGLKIEDICDERDPQAPLPWDFVDIGVDKEYLIKEYEKSLKEELTEDCRELCGLCGACEGEVVTQNAKEMLADELPSETGEDFKRDLQNQFRYRMYYEKTGLLRFVSHLDWMRMLFRRVSVLDLQTVFTRGFSPHPKIGLSPPLPVGVESVCEYFDISFYRSYDLKELEQAMTKAQIPGFKVFAIEALSRKPGQAREESLIATMDEEAKAQVISALTDFDKKDSLVFVKETPKRRKSYDLKDIIISWEATKKGIKIRKSLQSPGLYDVLEALTDFSREELYRFGIQRIEFHF